MKSNGYWARQFLFACGTLCMILVGADLLQGGTLETALVPAFSWSLVAAGLFTAARYYQGRKA